MLRETEPSLVAFYDIRPGKKAGLFLQPRSPHGTNWPSDEHTKSYIQKRRTQKRIHNEKALRETQTLRAGYSVVRRSQKFRPAAAPLPGGEGPPKFNHMEMVTTFTYTPSLVKIDARNFELSW